MHNICSSHTASVWIRATLRICTLCWRFVGKVPPSLLQNYLFGWIIYCFFTSMLLGHHKSVNMIYNMCEFCIYGVETRWRKTKNRFLFSSTRMWIFGKCQKLVNKALSVGIISTSRMNLMSVMLEMLISYSIKSSILLIRTHMNVCLTIFVRTSHWAPLTVTKRKRFVYLMNLIQLLFQVSEHLILYLLHHLFYRVWLVVHNLGIILTKFL